MHSIMVEQHRDVFLVLALPPVLTRRAASFARSNTSSFLPLPCRSITIIDHFFSASPNGSTRSLCISNTSKGKDFSSRTSERSAQRNSFAIKDKDNTLVCCSDIRHCWFPLPTCCASLIRCSFASLFFSFIVYSLEAMHPNLRSSEKSSRNINENIILISFPVNWFGCVHLRRKSSPSSSPSRSRPRSSGQLD